MQEASGSLIILALQSRKLGWIFSFDEVYHLRCALANTKILSIGSTKSTYIDHQHALS